MQTNCRQRKIYLFIFNGYIIFFDNTQLSKLPSILERLSEEGTICLKRAYGNWKSDGLKNWEESIKCLSIHAVQQFSYLSGKNSTDIALIIDALDLLYRGREACHTFVIVSSDSDYIPLAIYLRESGIRVFGVGKKTTSLALQNSCETFFYVEDFADSETTSNAPDLPQKTPADSPKLQLSSKAAAPTNPDTPKPSVPQASSLNPSSKGQSPSAPSQNTPLTSLPNMADENENELHLLLRWAWESCKDKDGYVSLSLAGSFVRKIKPNFNPKDYGYKKFSEIIEKNKSKYKRKMLQNNPQIIQSYQCKKS